MAIANAVEEEISLEVDSAMVKIPYWGTLKTEGFLHETYLGAIENHKKLLKKESYKMTSRGKKYLVSDFEKYLMKIEI